jgi:hypothetical protein
MELGELVDRREIIVCCGSGGVGKTTTAAAIALHAAVKGRKTLVLTIDPAKRLASAGASVLYGVAGLKTHAKVCLVIRREPDGVRRYVHLATGNYNAKTARIYSDNGYFTSDDDIANDVTARDWQFASPTFTLGKSFDTHGPIGPWIVTPEEIPDPHALQMRLFVNGDLRQEQSTSQMIYNIYAQIEHLSKVMTLEPGDLLATGTCAGVGIARGREGMLKVGDVVRVEIDRISISKTGSSPGG